MNQQHGAHSLLVVNLGDEKVELEVEEKLGSGAFGVVTRAVDNRGVSFAIKSVFCGDVQTYESIAQEVHLLFQLKHPNIVAMYGFDFIDSSAILIMEYCSQGTLNKRLDRPVDDMVRLQWMEQLGSALEYLHMNNIVHRDLKTDNVLIAENNDVKIADFGIARSFVCCRRGTLDNDPNTYLPDYLDAYMGTFAGTPYWVAPEVFNGRYTEKADVFSLGVIFYAICERMFVIYQGDRYYGAFTKYNGIDTGIGLVMYEQQASVALLFHQTHNEIVINAVRSLCSYDPAERMSLVDLRASINEAFFNSLQRNSTVEEEEDTLLMKETQRENLSVYGSVEHLSHDSGEKNHSDIHLDVADQNLLSDDVPMCSCSWLRTILCGCKCKCLALKYY